MANRPIERPADPAQESLIGALHTGFNVLRLLMIVMLVAYAFSGISRVQTGEQGLLVRFGRLVMNAATNTAVHEPGWQLALPDPFDEKIRLSGKTSTLIIDTFCFQRMPEQMTMPLASVEMMKESLTPGSDGALLTGDKNLAHGIFRVEYRVADGEAFVRSIGESAEAVQPMLRRLAESAILREMSWRRFEDVTRGDMSAVGAAVRERLRSQIGELGWGVEVVGVVPELVEPPSVRSAYREVSDAENRKKETEDKARAEATEILNKTAGMQNARLLETIRVYGNKQLLGAPEDELAEVRKQLDAELEQAGGDVAARLRSAAAEANETFESVKREYEIFTQWSKQHDRDPQLTRILLWDEMRAAVLQNPENEVFYLPSSKRTVITVNRDPDLERQREIERIQGKRK